MSRVFEEMQQEVAIQIARRFPAEGDPPERVAYCTGLSLDTVMELLEEKSA